jgi:hypothetical protein
VTALAAYPGGSPSGSESILSLLFAPTAVAA